MTELLIKQRVFSLRDSYDVYDGDGVPKYVVKGELFSFGHKIHIYDKATGAELGSVNQQLFNLLPTYELVADGVSVGTIRRKFTFFTQDYQVDYRGWDVEGDFIGWNYRVTQDGREVMAITKEWLAWGDTYTLRCWNPADEFAGLLLVIAIDAANCDHND